MANMPWLVRSGVEGNLWFSPAQKRCMSCLAEVLDLRCSNVVIRNAERLAGSTCTEYTPEKTHSEPINTSVCNACRRSGGKRLLQKNLQLCGRLFSGQPGLRL
jgi:hypothetical protein